MLIAAVAPRSRSRTTCTMPPLQYRFHPITVNWSPPLLARMKLDDALKFDHIDVLQHEMLLGVSGVICAKWEKFSSWWLAGFTASLALVVSNFDRVVSLTDRPTIYRVLIALGINVVLHGIQRVLGTMVAAGIAGGELGKKLPVLCAPTPS